jgi:hypothetical protein
MIPASVTNAISLTTFNSEPVRLPQPAKPEPNRLEPERARDEMNS